MQNEIDRLQSLVQEHEEYIANLELEAASTDNKIDGLAVLLGITPDTGNRRIIGLIKDEILRLRAEVERLNKMAEWITLAAARSMNGCPPGGRHVANCESCLVCWRRAARKAVEKEA